MKIYLTGANGFIGYHFLEYLLGQGHTVMCPIRRFEARNISRVMELFDKHDLKDMYIMPGDIRNYVDVARDLARFKPHAIFHLAAESHVGTSIKSPSTFVDTNVTGTMNMLNAAVDLKVPTFVHMSTCEVYGYNFGILNETSPFYPRSPYAASKAAADSLVQSYSHTYGLDTVILRPANNFGEYQHDEKVIPTFIRQALDSGEIKIHGSGDQRREWVHPKFVAEAAMAILHGSDKADSPRIYNISNGEDASINELAQMVVDELECTTPPSHVADRPGQVRHFRMSNYKLTEVFPEARKKLLETYDRIVIKPELTLKQYIPTLIEHYRQRYAY